MTENAYKRALSNAMFDEKFEDKTIALLEKESLKNRRNRRIAAIACCGTAAAACAVLAILLWGTPNNGDRMTQYVAQATDTATISAQGPSAAPTLDSRIVAVSSKYGGGESSYKTPDPGEVLVTEEVRRALEDKANEGSYFFVHIYLFTPEQYANNFSEYVYNGRTIAEWRELVDLSNGEYPYSEYNMDHGGNITEEQFEELERQAKTLDAAENYADAEQAYDAAVIPMLDETRAEREKAEAGRLKSLGYDVFMADTWTYKGKGEKEYYQILAGVLTKAQITQFAADEQCGYAIEWVHNGDGVLDWGEYKAELKY